MVRLMAGDRWGLPCLDLRNAEALRAQRLGDGAPRPIADRARAVPDPTGSSSRVRIAGPVTSGREGKTVMYPVTDAGRALLAAVGARAEITA